MSTQSTSARLSNQQKHDRYWEKRSRLTEIVSRMGESATPPEIREEAYRVGFGKVSSAMLVFVRNELWPDRVREQKGRVKGRCTKSQFTPTLMIVPMGSDKRVSCPACASQKCFMRGVYRRIDGSAKRYYTCRQCKKHFASVGASDDFQKQMHPRRAAAMVATEKECSKCKRILPVSDFSKKAGDAHLYVSACRECVNHHRRRNYGKRSIRFLYGLSPEQYAALMARQDGKCAICGNPETGRRGQRGFPLAIDHCHETGKVRGLLCNKCNLGIGNFNDDAARLEAAAKYLRERAEH